MSKMEVVIATLRREKGWSQVDLADRSGVSREMIGKYERGKAIPSVDAAKKIADAFEVSLDYLVGDGVTASFDKKAVHRLQEIQAMDSKEKESLFGIIDAVIRDYKVRKAYV